MDTTERTASPAMAAVTFQPRTPAAMFGSLCLDMPVYWERTTSTRVGRRTVHGVWLAWAIAISGGGLASPSFAENWRFQPTVSVRETWTDNVTLVPSSQARSDFVTEVSPSFTVQGRGSRARIDIDYRPTGLLYARDSGRNDLLNMLNASGAFEAIERFLFVEARAQITQQTVSAFGPQPTSNVSDTNNRTETRVFSVSPYIKGIAGGVATYEARYQASTTRTQADAGVQGDSRVFSGNLASITDFASFGWMVDFRDARYDFRSGQDASTQFLRGTVIYHFDPELWFFVRGGRESNDYSQEDRSFNTYGAGMEWAPTGRTRISAENEKRFFGWGHRYSFRHRTQGVSYSLLATKEDTTNLEQLTRNSVSSLFERFSDLLSAQFPDPQQRAEQVRQLLTRTGISQEPIPQAGFLSSAVQLERRVEGSVALIGARNTWTFSAYHRNTQPLTFVNDAITADALAAAEVTELGVLANLNHRLSAQDSVSVLASWQRNRGAGNDPLETISRRIELMATRQLSPSTNWSIGFRTSRFDGGGVTTANDYRENAIFGSVSHRF